MKKVFTLVFVLCSLFGINSVFAAFDSREEIGGWIITKDVSPIDDATFVSVGSISEDSDLFLFIMCDDGIPLVVLRPGIYFEKRDSNVDSLMRWGTTPAVKQQWKILSKESLLLPDDDYGYAPFMRNLLRFDKLAVQVDTKSNRAVGVFNFSKTKEAFETFFEYCPMSRE